MSNRWDLTDLDANIDCTPFTWGDAVRQGTTGQIAIPNRIKFENIIRQAHALDPVYRLLGGFKITSWLRTPEHNAKVGGAQHSMHLEGLATDFVPLHCTPDEARARIKAAGIYPGRTEIDATTWVHLDLKNNVDFYARPPR